jgi:hypothetical protein
LITDGSIGVMNLERWKWSPSVSSFVLIIAKIVEFSF